MRLIGNRQNGDMAPAGRLLIPHAPHRFLSEALVQLTRHANSLVGSARTQQDRVAGLGQSVGQTLPLLTGAAEDGQVDQQAVAHAPSPGEGVRRQPAGTCR